MGVKDDHVRVVLKLRTFTPVLIDTGSQLNHTVPW